MTFLLEMTIVRYIRVCSLWAIEHNHSQILVIINANNKEMVKF